MDGAGTRSPEASAAARRGRPDLIARNPVTQGAMDQDGNPVMPTDTDRDGIQVTPSDMDPAHNPVTPGAMDQDGSLVTPRDMDPSLPLPTKSPDTTRRRPSYTDRDSIMVRAGVGEDDGSKDLFRYRESGARSRLSQAWTALPPASIDAKLRNCGACGRRVRNSRRALWGRVECAAPARSDPLPVALKSDCDDRL